MACLWSTCILYEAYTVESSLKKIWVWVEDATVLFPSIVWIPAFPSRINRGGVGLNEGAMRKCRSHLFGTIGFGDLGGKLPQLGRGSDRQLAYSSASASSAGRFWAV